MNNELIAAISEVLADHFPDEGGFPTSVPGLGVMRSSSQALPLHMHYRPQLCVVAQGRKQVFIGDRMIEYGAMQSLVVTVDVPVLSQAVAPSDSQPFLGAALELDVEMIMDVAGELEGLRHAQRRTEFGLLVEEMDAQISAALVRLLSLMKRPEAIRVLYPSIMREICYWLLAGPAGPAVKRMVTPSGPTFRIAEAIAVLRRRFNEPVNIAELAATASMSTSSFHQHFRTLTSMSPLQYQKHLRLLEARRRMIAQGDKAGVAAFAVGYESISQFNREYSRMFGSPPRRETQRAMARDELHRDAELEGQAG